MSNQQITVRPKQMLVFLGLAVAFVVGVVIFFFASSGEKTDSSSSPIKTSGSVSGADVDTDSFRAQNDGFLGDKGATVQAVDGKVYIDEDQVSDGNLHAFNYFSEAQNKTIYFFVVKASDGSFRAAANACEVCFESKKGFRQIGDQIRCENCQTMYSKDQIALQKGGCNPRPIDEDVEVIDGRLAINLTDIEKTADLF